MSFLSQFRGKLAFEVYMLKSIELKAKMKNKDKNYYPRYSSQKGFTLIELLVVMAIVVIITAVALSSLARSQDLQVFNNNFEKIYSLINTARSLAISGKGQLDYSDFDNDMCNHNGAINQGSCSSPDYVTPANYAVHFASNEEMQVILFADLNLPSQGATGQKGKYDSGGSYTTGDDLKLDNLSLPSDLILEIEDYPGNISEKGSIFYSPNYADISLENLKVDPYLIIRLKENLAVGRCKQIRIHKLAGIPEVEECVPY